jgi:uncharacterized repeat protein (TIGR03803 family)
MAHPVQTQSLPGHRPAAIAHLAPVGRLEAARELKLAIGLPLRNKEGLTNLLQRVYDPTSPDYHHFLTPAQFAETFGPTAEDYQAVTAFAKANGLTVTATHSNRVLLDVSGPVSNIEKAFHVTMRTYRHPREDRLFYAPDVEPSLELATPVLHISGLDNYIQPHPMSLRITPLADVAGVVSASGSGPSGTYMGHDFRAAYVPGVALTGAGQMVGLLEFDGYYPSDISTYASMVGIAAVPLTNVYVDGFDGMPGDNNREVALDIDLAGCMAPGLSSVIVYEGDVTDDILNRMATDDLANQLNSSWSYPIDAVSEQIFQQFAAQGQSFFNAAGDGDAWVGEIATPCDDPNLTSVGGTTLTTGGAGGAWVSETAWNWDVEYGPQLNGEGGGGGISTTYPIPNWQLGISTTANQGSCLFRNIPDVALTADNVFVVADDGESFDVGGTSCATVLWAAFVALANEQAVANGRPPLGFINPAIYALGQSPSYTNCFHDITTGNNTWSGSPTLFYAVAGYDLCSGWGTPVGSNLINVLAPLDALQISPLGGWSSSGGVGGPLTPESQNYTLTNIGNVALDWGAAATVPWLSLSIDAGTLNPGGGATVVASLNGAARNLPLGSYSATIWFTNLTDGAIQSRAFSLTIINPPVITAQPVSLAVIGGTTVTFTSGALGSQLNCQWQYNGIRVTNGGGVSVSQTTETNADNIDVSVASALTISNVAAADGGIYAFVASNAAGVAVSSNAVLTIIPSGPVIVQQPISQTALVGATVQFSVAADGDSPLTCQWQQNEINLTDTGGVSGSATPTLTITGASSASIGTYTVVVSNAISTVTSTGAVLTVEVAVPGQQLVQNGGFETGSFSSWSETGNFVNCSVSSSPPAVHSGVYGARLGPPGSLGYLWQSLPTVAGQFYLLSLWLDSPDGLAPNEFLAVWNGNVMFDQTNLGALGWTNLQFYVMATDTNTVLEFGFRDDQSSLGLDNIQVIPLASADGPPIIAAQPSNQVSLQGGAATFSVLSAGQLPLLYQWQFDGSNLDNATNATLVLTNLTNSQAGAYDVIVSNSLGLTISSNALLTVLTGSSELITFDDLPYRYTPVPAGYNSLNWSNFYYLNGVVSPSSGYNAGMVSIPKVAYNGYGAPAAISASAPFAFLSAYLTAAWNDNLQVEVQGYNGSTLSYDNTYTLSATSPTLIAFNYLGVTSVHFISSGGTPHAGYRGGGSQFVMDNVSVFVVPIAPAPIPMPLAVLYFFGGFDGGYPSSSLVQGADGSLYGTTEYGGTYGDGTVFRMTTNGTLATLLCFDGSNANPYGGLALGADGNLYGTTEYGGTNNDGTVFRMTPDGTLSTLASFKYDVTGGNPSAVLTQGADGSFYGTTAYGGANDDGTVFRMTPDGILTTLVSFNNANGASPYDGLTLGADGSFYGTTFLGGTNDAGTAFRMTTNGTLTTLLSFSFFNGYPYGTLALGTDGNFYGTTEYGGTNYDGSVFRMTTNGTLAILASFNYDVTGAYPSTALVQGADGNFYGTTASGGPFGTTYYDGTYGGGTIFSVTTNGTLTTLVSFESTNGLSPEAALVQGADGFFYGTTYYGGTGFNGIYNSGDGVVFRLGAAPATTTPAIVAQPASQMVPVSGAAVFSANAGGAAPLRYFWRRNGRLIAGATGSCYMMNNVQLSDSGSRFSCLISNAYGSCITSNAALTVFNASGPLFSFNGPDGGLSSAALTQGADGDFYGTTEYGGTNGNGTVFRMTTNGLLTTLASFNYYVTGGNPWAGLAQGGDGNFYGTAAFGGANDLGTVFRVTSNGVLTALVSFDSTDGAEPYGTLVPGADGDFYGTTYYGGIYGAGTVFRVTSNGTLSTLASFNGGYPYTGLTRGSDGSFYGTTVYGGTYNYGTIFSLTTNGTLTTLVSLDSINGAYPFAALERDADGNFYGTTTYGGTHNVGTVFRMTTNGILTTLVSFNTTNGAYPYGALVKGVDGDFHGTTYSGGTDGVGTVFSMTTNGILTNIFSFDGANGSSPIAALIQGTDGSFYGTTSYGGSGFDGLSSSGNGTVFRLMSAFAMEVPRIVTQPVSQTVAAGVNVTFTASVLGAGPFTYQWQIDGANYLNPVTSGMITTVAGDGTNGYSGDGGAATNADLSNPYGVAVDACGNLFIADTYNFRIREVGMNGVITTVAGDGTNGYSGDGGAATNAGLSDPYGVAVDAFGNLFIADTYNFRIREVGMGGVITTVAGDGTNGYSGDGGAATNAGLSKPCGVAVDGWGNLFIADTYNFRVREVGTNGIITTVAGSGTNGYFGDDGPATNANLDYPRSVAVDAFGNLFIADSGNNCIREVDTNGFITTLAGNGMSGYFGDGGPASDAELNNPTAVSVDAAGNVFVTDSGNNRIREVDTNGIITTVAGNGMSGYSGDGGPASNAELNGPASVVVDAAGNVFVTDSGNNRIREILFQGPTLVLTNVATSAAGSYDVVVSNAYGSITSGVATLMVGLPPTITSQPTNLALEYGDIAIFSVTAAGTSPFFCQWQFNGVNLTDNFEITGSQSSVLTLTGVTLGNAGTYRVVVTNVYGSTNASATLTVQAATPVLVWTNPAPITYGASLDSNQLNATASGPGSFAYIPTNGSVLDAGTNTLSVVFTPADSVDYNSATDVVSLVVSPAPLTVTASNASEPFGQIDLAFTGAITGVTNGDNITATYSCSATNDSPVGTYPIVPALVDPDNRQTNYAVTLVNGTLTITGAPILTWTPVPITYGAALGSNQLNATTSVPGSFAYIPTNGTVLDTETNTLSVIFTPADTVDYGIVSDSVSLVVSPAPLTVTASNASELYGQILPVFTGAITGVTNGDNITAAYSCSATNNSPVGTYPIVPALVDPDDRQTNYTVTLVNGTLTIAMANPVLGWTNPAPITYGAPLDSNQLNATASVPGTFDYIPTNGTVLNAGTNTLSVIFTPADMIDYNSAIGSVSLVVSPAPLNVTASNASEPYGENMPVFMGAITGVTNGDNITATYSCGATNGSPVGTYPIVPALVDPDNRQTNYTVTLVNGTLTITGAPVLTWTPTPIMYGAGLDSNQLNATTSVPGAFAYIPTNGTVLDAGTNTLSVIFTPADTLDFGSVSDDVSLVVSPAPLSVTASNAIEPYGEIDLVFTGAITGVTNGDNITATYSCSATNNSPAGTYPIVPALVDPYDRQTNYTVTLVNGTLTIAMANPVLVWTNPAPITYGASVDSNQLNATASVPGTFAYIPTNGTVLDAGTNTLSVIFTPADTIDYNSASGSVSLVVSPAPLTVTASNASEPYGEINLVFTGSITGVTNGDNITVTYSCSATNDRPVGTYPIVPGLVDPDNRQTNYTVTLVNGALTITMANPVLAWTNPAPIVYGAPLDSNQLNATASVPGSFAYFPTNGTVLDTGTNTLSVIFTPADTIDYNSAAGSVSLIVSPAPLSVTASNASEPYGEIALVFTGSITGVTNGDDITATYSCSATNDSPLGTYPIVPALVDPDNRQTNYTVTLVNGTLTITVASPVLVWTNPAPITYGAPLDSNQLNAAASVPGTFAYIPTNGTILDAGTNTLSVIFTPADTIDYNSASGSVSLVVSPAPLNVTASNAIEPYGEIDLVFTGSITGVTNGDNITATYSCSATNDSPVGTYPIVPALVDPDNRQTNYTVALVNGTLTITGAPILTWTPAPITYGAALGSNQLNATTSVPGSLAYIPTNGTVLDAGTNTLSVIFTPADTSDFGSAIDDVSLVVSPAALTVTASKVSEPYGQILPAFTGSITGVTNGDNITATYSCGATNNSAVGTYSIVPALVDPEDRQTNYVVTLINGTLTITMAEPVLAWTNPAPITYGAPLDSNQLNAAASVPGGFAYVPTNGAVLDAGTNTLSVIFTPVDTVDYDSATDSVSLVVSPAPLTVTASNASEPYGQPLPVFMGSITGVTNGDNITATYRCSATNNSPVGTYPIVPALVDPDNRQTNYTVALVNGTFTVIALPDIQSVRQSGSSFIFTWNATTNRMYQIQSTTNLTQPNWTAVGGTLTASNSTMTISEPIGASVQRFYRVVLLP